MLQFAPFMLHKKSVDPAVVANRAYSWSGTSNNTSHTKSAATDGIVVILLTEGGASNPTLSVTYGGVSMTKHVTATGTAFGYSHVNIFTLANPGSGAQTISISSSSSIGNGRAVVLDISDMNQSTPVSGTDVDSSASYRTNVTLSITSSDGNGLMISGWTNRNVRTHSVTGESHEYDKGYQSAGHTTSCADEIITTTSAVQQNCNWSSSETSCGAAIRLQRA